MNGTADTTATEAASKSLLAWNPSGLWAAMTQLSDYMAQEHQNGKISFQFLGTDDEGNLIIEARIDAADGMLMRHTDQCDSMIDASLELAAKTVDA